MRHQADHHSAAQISTVLLPCPSLLDQSMPLRCSTEQSLCSSYQRCALPLRISSAPLLAMPLPVMSSPVPALPLRVFSLPCPCATDLFCALPPHLTSLLCLCFAALFVTMPLLCYAMPCHSNALPVSSEPLRISSAPLPAMPSRLLTVPLLVKSPPVSFVRFTAIANLNHARPFPSVHFLSLAFDFLPLKPSASGIVPLTDSIQLTVIQPFIDGLHQIILQNTDREDHL